MAITAAHPISGSGNAFGSLSFGTDVVSPLPGNSSGRAVANPAVLLLELKPGVHL